MNYAFLPPEVNSARMYSGPGSASLLAAVASWDMVAIELASAAEGYRSVISTLSGMYWWGPASAAMLAATGPFIDWLEITGALASETANQAAAAAAAYEQAYAMTVPPIVVAANRALLVALVASNFFGQNTAAIEATESEYAEMWAQDAGAMYDYAATSAMATALVPFSAPGQDTNPAGLAAQSAAVSQAAGNAPASAQSVWSQLTSLVPDALPSLSNWPNILPDDFSILDGIFAMYATVGVTQDVESFCAGIIGAENNLGLLGAASENPAEVTPGALGLGAMFSSAERSAVGGATNAVTVSMSRAGSIGQLSVPPSWAAPSSGSASALSVSGLTTIPGTEVAEQGAPGMPGMPVGTGKRATSVIPRYGVRLTVMARPPAAG
ncbi:PPE family protein [Mycobacterium marinum MB2]|uniref:PPE family protein n=1 Tax=Mycobacterium marinum TaxID=1781 RepID=UPI0003587484|nr:PPE family protein [Mycobacterium marinum]EPQ73178.1 PPE family protein [Mycobacterium marinum MB2]